MGEESSDRPARAGARDHRHREPGPLHDVADWASGNIWLLAAIGCVGVMALIRLLRSEHVTAYQNFDYQGSPQGQTQTAKTETV